MLGINLIPCTSFSKPFPMIGKEMIVIPLHAGGVDYTPTTAEVIFTPRDGFLERCLCISVPILADGQSEGTETFFVDLIGEEGTRIGRNSSTVFILDSI